MPDFFDFMVEGGDELLHSHQCPHCGNRFHEDEVKWLDRAQRLLECPSCHEAIQIPDS